MNNVRKKRLFGITAGILIGSINGLLGGGGGMLAVPALTALGLNAKQSHATAILVILPISIMSAIIYLAAGRADWSVLWSGGIGVLLGGAAGAVALSKLDSGVVRLLFAIVMIAVGIRQAIG